MVDCCSVTELPVFTDIGTTLRPKLLLYEYSVPYCSSFFHRKDPDPKPSTRKAGFRALCAERLARHMHLSESDAHWLMCLASLSEPELGASLVPGLLELLASSGRFPGCRLFPRTRVWPRSQEDGDSSVMLRDQFADEPPTRREDVR